MTQSLMSQSASPRFGLPYLYPAQAQKEFFINHGAALTDAMLHTSTLGIAETLPQTAGAGDTWLISGSASGYLSDKQGWIAVNLASVGAPNWHYIKPQKGMRIYDKAAMQFYLYTDQWVIPPNIARLTAGQIADNQIRDAINSIIDILRDTGLMAR